MTRWNMQSACQAKSMHDTSYMTNYHAVLAIFLTAISSYIQSLILLASRDINIAFVPQDFASLSYFQVLKPISPYRITP